MPKKSTTTTTTTTKPAIKRNKEQVNTRLSAEAVAIIAAAQAHFGLTQVGVLEMALRDLKRAHGLQSAEPAPDA